MSILSKTTLILGASALLLSACSGANDAASKASDAAKEASPATKEVVAEAKDTMSKDLCVDMGPQTPRDIASKTGVNPVSFPSAPASTEMNLCNIHTHTNAEHKGPGFSTFVNGSDYGGYACNGTDDLSEAELAPYDGSYGKVKSGDTIEVPLGPHNMRCNTG